MKRIEAYGVYDGKSREKPVVYFSNEEQASKLMDNFVFQDLIGKKINTQIEKTIIEIFDTFDEYNEVKILKEVQSDLDRLSEGEISLLESEGIISTTWVRMILEKIKGTEKFTGEIPCYEITSTTDGFDSFHEAYFFSELEAKKVLKKSVYYSLSESTLKIYENYKDYFAVLKEGKISLAISKLKNPDILKELRILNI